MSLGLVKDDDEEPSSHAPLLLNKEFDTHSPFNETQPLTQLLADASSHQQEYGVCVCVSAGYEGWNPRIHSLQFLCFDRIGIALSCEA